MLDGIDALLVTDRLNIRYLTGFVSMATRERESYLLLTGKEVYFFTNALYLEQVRKYKTLLTDNRLITIIEITRDEPLSSKLEQIISKLTIGRLGFEFTDLNYAEYQKLQAVLKNITLVPASNQVEGLRLIKRDDEIRHIKKACQIMKPQG